MEQNLGRLDKVDLRKAWQDEAGEFTPWLAREENIKLLSEAIGLELEVQAQEKDVGPFRADILCKDTLSKAWVLIENQLEKTDHTHLGQLLTYAAGLDAVTIVWIAQRFTEEHRAALDWLNRYTDDQINFFGMEIELWRIGASLMAPKFNVVSKPNDWSRSVTERAHAIDRGELTETKQVQLEFWEGFARHLEEKSLTIKPRKALPQHWMDLAIGRSGFWLAAIASTWDSASESYGQGELRAEFVVGGDASKAYFELLAVKRKEIEAELGESLTWHSSEGVKMCKAYVRKTANIGDRGAWAEDFEWLRKKCEALHRVFGPRVKKLSLEAALPQAEV